MKHPLLFLLLFIVNSNTLADEKAIKAVNASVKTVEDGIQTGKYSQLVIEEFSDYEGSPAKITFFFLKDSSVVAAKVSVGHEIWVNEFYYYFNEVGNIIKYLKKAIDNPYNPENEAIIFDGKDKIKK